MPLANGTGRGSSTSPSKFELSTAREEITGLKYVTFTQYSLILRSDIRRHIVQDLQKEHSVASQKIKLLESENQILRSETELL